MLLEKFLRFRKDRKMRLKRIDQVVEQVKRILESEDQKLILMVRR